MKYDNMFNEKKVGECQDPRWFMCKHLLLE